MDQSTTITYTTSKSLARPASDYKSGFLWFTKSPTKLKNDTRSQNKPISSIKNIKTVSSVAGTATLVNNNYVNPFRTSLGTTTQMYPAQKHEDSFEAYSDIRPNLSNKYEYKWPVSTRPPLVQLSEQTASLPNNLLLGNFIFSTISTSLHENTLCTRQF
jgi:hypothetical protein